MRQLINLSAFFLSLITLAAPIQLHAGASEDDYDRLDGTGRSGKRVNVIEWEGNLEVHVYPAGSVHGLAMKIDDRNPQKKVMVIGYRFKGQPDAQLVRRNILSIPLTADFRVYRDPASGSEYDKFVVTDRTLKAPLMAFRLDPPPTQLYPEGHSALAENARKSERNTSAPRQPASDAAHRSGVDEETGGIRPYSW